MTNKHTLDAALKPRSPLVSPVPMTPSEEAAALRRSEEHIFAQLREDATTATPDRSTLRDTMAHMKAKPSLWGQFAASFGMGFAAIAAVWIGIIAIPRKTKSTKQASPWHASSLQAPPRATGAKQGEITYAFRAHRHRPAHVHHPNHWKLKAHPASRFHMTRKARKHTVVALHQGGLHVQVNPKKKQRFEVHHRGAHVHVRGTVFSVETHPKGMRVEVQRGRVQVQYQGRTVDLPTGRGVRIDFTAKRLKESHKLPPQAQRSPLKRARWLLKRKPAPAQLLALAHELLHDTMYAPTQRGRALFALKDRLQQRGDLPGAERLLRAIAAKQLTTKITELALYDIGVLCYKQQKKAASAAAFRAFLQQFPKSQNASLARWYVKELAKKQ